MTRLPGPDDGAQHGPAEGPGTTARRAIPAHLSHLRTDRRGLPVPFINRWGPERVESLSIRFDVYVGQRALFVDDTDQATPDFTAQNQQRQRQCMTQGLCQVCARKIPWSDRYLAIAELSVEHIVLDGDVAAVVTEPWLCPDCAAFATQVCPALIRRHRDERLQLVHVTSRDQVRLVTSRGWVEGPLEAESKRTQPVMWVKALLTALNPTPAT